MIAILLKASIVLITLLFFYKAILERESFYSINRIYLLACLLFAGTFPFAQLPKMVENQGYVAELIESLNKQAEAPQVVDEPIEHINFEADMDMESSSGSDTPDIEFHAEADGIDVHVDIEPNTAKTPPIISKQASSSRGIGYWIWLVYLFGVGVLGLNLIAQVLSTYLKAWRNPDKIITDEGVIINLEEEEEPCSFFKYIFINPSSYDYDTYEQILAHEQIHVRKGHTIDLLLAELAVVFLWFNPFVWIFRREVEKNLEYQTDDLLVNKEKEQKEHYQLNLVKIATYNKPLAVTTNYNQSLIKQRILKMNSKKSNPYSYWKYTFMVPVLFVTLLLINQPKMAIAGEGLASSEDIGQNYTEESLEDHFQANDIDVPNIDIEDLASDQDKEAILQDVLKNDPTIVTDNAFNNALLYAVESGQIEIVKLLLEKGANVNAQTNDGWTPLMMAAHANELEIAKLLTGKGAEVNMQSNDKMTALMFACYEGHQEMAEFLINKGANINARSDQDWTALMSAINSNNTALVKYLIGKGAETNIATQDGMTLLMVAMHKGHLEIVDLLMEEGADYKVIDNNGWNMVMEALDHGHTDYAKLFLEKGGIDINDHDNEGWSILMEAVEEDNQEMVNYLISKGADINATTNDGTSVLMVALHYERPAMAELLLNKNARIAIHDNDGWTLLMEAIDHGNNDFAKRLIDSGIDINEKTNEGWTALMEAINENNQEIVDILLQKGAEVNAITDGGITPLNVAVRHGHIDLVKQLMDAGAKAEDPVKNTQGARAREAMKSECEELIQAVWSSNINAVKAALKNADPNCIYRQRGGPRTALVAAARQGNLNIGRLLVEAGAEIELMGQGDESPLMAAAGGGHLPFVRYLVDKGADINRKVPANGNALLVAAGGGHTHVAEYLIGKGAEVNSVLRGDGTPLIVAVKGGHFATAKLLLEKGADPYQNSPGDEYAMYHARVSGNSKMVDLLKKYESRK